MADSPAPAAPSVLSAAGEWPDWPEYALVPDLLPLLERWAAAGQACAIATLVEVTGTSPRPVGSEMVAAASGEVAGYVSGGCVEAAVATEAREVLATGVPKLLDYGAGAPALDVRLTCGGRIRIALRRLDDAAAFAARWRAARRARTAFEERIDWTDPEGGARSFLQRRAPPLRLVAVGGDPVVLALARLAPSFGMEFRLLRPNGPERPPPGVAAAHYDRRRLEVALADLALDAHCALYTLAHDADIDHAVLLHALRSPAYCVGALGARRKAEGRIARLRADGIGDDALSRLHTPAGLPIGGSAPQEIALSILAQAVAAHHGR